MTLCERRMEKSEKISDYCQTTSLSHRVVRLQQAPTQWRRYDHRSSSFSINTKGMISSHTHTHIVTCYMPLLSFVNTEPKSHSTEWSHENLWSAANVSFKKAYSNWLSEQKRCIPSWVHRVMQCNKFCNLLLNSEKYTKNHSKQLMWHVELSHDTACPHTLPKALNKSWKASNGSCKIVVSIQPWFGSQFFQTWNNG